MTTTTTTTTICPPNPILRRCDDADDETRHRILHAEWHPFRGESWPALVFSLSAPTPLSHRSCVPRIELVP
ncbi:hypothetical protein RJ55_01617 [Drechmeria coniospora]|nr:hypothetical protein RJ55_01617 [Drechmeria coniospora]